MRSVYPILFIIFYFLVKTILIPLFPHHIYGISLIREKDFIKYWPQGFESEADKATYEWWKGKLLIAGFNTVCMHIAASFLKVGDESVSEIRSRTPMNSRAAVIEQATVLNCVPGGSGLRKILKRVG